MPELPDSVSSQNEPFLLPCPMCGARIDPEAESCSECGEFLRESAAPTPRNEIKICTLIRGLVGMHVIVGGSLIFVGIVLFVSFSDGFAAPEFAWLIGAGCFVLSVGNFWVVPGILGRQIPALKLSMLITSLTSLLCFLTICLFLIGLLLIAGIIQAHRISKLIREQGTLSVELG